MVMVVVMAIGLSGVGRMVALLAVFMVVMVVVMRLVGLEEIGVDVELGIEVE